MISPVKLWRNQKQIAKLLGREGIVVTMTTIHIPPEGFTHLAPYDVGLIKLDDGQMITAQIVHSASSVAIGDRVITVLRRTKEASADGVIPYGIKAKRK